jgi:hypothetical protein
MEKPVTESRIETRIKWASLLIGSGLLIQLCTMFRVHPLAFVAFVVIGCPLIGSGILLYLWSVVSPQK